MLIRYVLLDVAQSTAMSFVGGHGIVTVQSNLESTGVEAAFVEVSPSCLGVAEACRGSAEFAWAGVREWVVVRFVALFSVSVSVIAGSALNL